MTRAMACWLALACGCTGIIADPSSEEGRDPRGGCRGPECVGRSEDAVVCDGPPAPGKRRLRRLTHEELDRTVSDLLGVESNHARGFVADTVVGGFDNHADALVVSPLLADQLRRAAEDLAARVDLGRLVPCEPAAGDATCARAFVEEFGARAFRRPPTPAQVARFVGLWELGAADGFEAGVRLVVAAMLQSPSFLYRSELGVDAGDGTYRLDDYELASELSYLLWGTMPDEPLFEAARRGTLATPEGLEAEARRMLDSPRARPVVRRFLSEWLEIDRVETVPKDDATYPGFDATARSALREQAEAWLEATAFDGPGTLEALLVDPHDGEPGLLTLPAVLAVHARPNSSSPVHRGKLVRERLLCQELPPPPPGVNAEPPPLDPSLTTRERYAAHSTVEACAGCHRLMDPIGFAFEHYDGLGRRRDREDGGPIDASGAIVATRETDGTFDGAAELAAHLAGSAEVRDCFAREMARFAYGTTADRELPCVLRDLQSRFDGDIRELIVALVTSPHFVARVP